MIGCCYESPIGKMLLIADEAALVGAWFLGQKHFPNLKYTEGENEVLSQAKTWLDDYFAGNKRILGIPLAPMGSEYQHRVWSLLREIPYGNTVTYGDLDKILRSQGVKSSPQAVGGAVGRNPAGILIPCHRVVGADGSLTGYAGGVEKKAYLLRMEAEHG